LLKGHKFGRANDPADLPTCHHREAVADLLNLSQKPVQTNP